MTMSRASSTVIPLCARNTAYSSANRVTRSASWGEMTDALSISTPNSEARARMRDSSPKSVMVATSRESSVAVALMIRSSSPSGRTMCFLLPRARSIKAYSNISGVTTSEVVIFIRERTSSVSTFCVNNWSAVSYFRCESAAKRPRAETTWSTDS